MIEVVIPVRNAPEILWLCLTHYLCHAHSGRLVSMVTILDNCSTAPGMDLVLGDARRHGMRVIRHERDVGVWTSVNRGLALARSPYVLVLTSDVLLGPAAVEILHCLLEQMPPEVAMIGPEVYNSLQEAPALARIPSESQIVTDRYNGSCWLMRWDMLRERVGWYDSRFYVVAGDTDYAERVTLARLFSGVAVQVPSIHLDKQVRRREFTAGQDTDIEIRDLQRFHEKWAAYPDVLARHPVPNKARWEEIKAGWKEKIVA